MEDRLDPLHYGPVRFVRAGEKPLPLEPKQSTNFAARLDTWLCQQTQADLPRALTLARSMSGDTGLIWVVTDHEPPAVELSTDLLWQSFGSAHSNLAIINAVRSSNADGDRCLVEVANWGKTTVESNLDMGAQGQLALKLGPGEVLRQILTVPSSLELLQLRLPSDALAVDNEAWLPQHLTPDVAIQLDVSDAKLAQQLRKAILAIDGARERDQRPQLIFTTGEMASTAATWVCQIGMDGEANALPGPFVIDVNHPLCEGIDLNGVIWGASSAPTPAGHQPLILAGDVALLSFSANDGMHLNWNFTPQFSTLQRSPALPILIYNLVRLRAETRPGLDRLSYRLGETVTLRTDENTAVTLTNPKGEQYKPTGPEMILPTPTVGLYEVELGALQQTFAVNALNGQESDLRTALSGSWGDWRAHQQERRAWRSLVPFTLLLLLAVLLLHWWLIGRIQGEQHP